MNSAAPVSLRRRILFSLAAVALLWLAAEIFMLVCAWLRPPQEPAYRYLFTAHPYRAYAGVPHAIVRNKTASLNSLGLRGPEIPIAKPPDTVRIVCLGGSTTWGQGASTDSHTYPARMEVLLREHYRDAPFRIEVINAGLPAYCSIESLGLFQTTLLDLLPDIAVCHQGLNDCWIYFDCEGFRSDYSHARKTLTFPTRRFWEYSPLLSFLFARDSLTNPYFPARFFDTNRLFVAQPEMLKPIKKKYRLELEPQMIAAFERHTRTFVSVAKANGVLPVLSTQISQDDPSLASRWSRAMAQLNNVMFDLGRQESVPVIDCARLLPWNPVDYYDQVHLKDTPGGLGRQAEIFAEGLIQSGTIERAAKRLVSNGGKRS